MKQQDQQRPAIRAAGGRRRRARRRSQHSSAPGDLHRRQHPRLLAQVGQPDGVERLGAAAEAVAELVPVLGLEVGEVEPGGARPRSAQAARRSRRPRARRRAAAASDQRAGDGAGQRPGERPRGPTRPRRSAPTAATASAASSAYPTSARSFGDGRPAQDDDDGAGRRSTAARHAAPALHEQPDAERQRVVERVHAHARQQRPRAAVEHAEQEAETRRAAPGRWPGCRRRA